MNVSPDFSPSIKLMKPYFLSSIFFYILSMLTVFSLDINLQLNALDIVAWVHLYLLGFVMLSIFSAMAQLGPVVSEVKHVNENIFKYLWIFLILGLILMLYGFYENLSFLLYGGFLVLIAMGIYAIEFLLTLKNMRRHTSITKAMKLSNFFLLFGIITGLVMASGFNGLLDINTHQFLNIHIFSLLGGFILLLIMGISFILIPMFGFSKRISDNKFSYSFITLSVGLVVMICSHFFLEFYLQILAYLIIMSAIIIFLLQLYQMFSSRKKVVHDIWARSIYIAYSSFFISVILINLYLVFSHELILKLGMWFFLIGFIGFLIMGNFYKIIPFLVWFQIYAPLIEEKPVPMLHELVPQRLANLQWFYSALGLLFSSLGILFQESQIFYAGVLLLLVGGVLFFIVINKILKAKL